MAEKFEQIDRVKFAALVTAFPFKRRINAVHMHHTWRPNHAQYRGRDTIVAMWRFHTQTNGWSDIAQHITIAPDGTIWLGRNWNTPPASASGHNGNATAGPFMFEIIGNFDHGNDRLDGEQLKTVIEVIARVQSRFGLPPESLAFHNTMSSKTCPGSGVEYGDILKQVQVFATTLSAPAVARVPDDLPFPASAIAADQSVDLDPRISEVMASWSRQKSDDRDPPNAELRHDQAEGEVVVEQDRNLRRESGLSPEMLETLRPHLVNLNEGRFSSEGEWKSSQGDVDAIFEQHLPQAFQSAKKRNAPLRVVFFAHGGLVKESAGLGIAHRHVGWWLQNNIYPIYFVWETGLFETIGQLLDRTREGTARVLPRDIYDHTSDFLIEETARALQAHRIWGGDEAKRTACLRPRRRRSLCCDEAQGVLR